MPQGCTQVRLDEKECWGVGAALKKTSGHHPRVWVIQQCFTPGWSLGVGGKGLDSRCILKGGLAEAVVDQL